MRSKLPGVFVRFVVSVLSVLSAGFVVALGPAIAALAEAPRTEAPASVDGPVPRPAAETPLSRGRALLDRHELQAFEEAVVLLEAEHGARPDDVDVTLALAQALNGVMRAKTGACLVLVDGAADTPANKKLWATLGPRAWELGRRVAAARPGDEAAALTVAESNMYRTASLGILTAVMEGAAKAHLANAEDLVARFPRGDAGMGEVYLGVFHLIAPWPVGDLGEGRKHIEKALAVAPGSVRNRYYLGLMALRAKDWATAEKAFTAARDEPCLMTTERTYCALLKREARRGLEVIAAR